MYLYEVGSKIHPLTGINGDSTWFSAHFPLMIAEGALEPLITRTVFQLRTSVQAGVTLLSVVREMNAHVLDPAHVEDYQNPIGVHFGYRLQNAVSAFEAVLGAELALIPLYVVTPKSGHVLSDLIESGQVCFPDELATKVPAAIPDVQAATKCIAFELSTAAGFHLHRANEAVVRAYFAVVAPNEKAPKSGNLGDYLKVMSEKNLGDAKVIAALGQIKDLHRNPIMHPEQSIDSTDEAVSLMGAVRAAIGEMLKAIPLPSNSLPGSPSAL
jgi:hypothetical protein